MKCEDFRTIWKGAPQTESDDAELEGHLSSCSLCGTWAEEQDQPLMNWLSRHPDLVEEAARTLMNPAGRVPESLIATRLGAARMEGVVEPSLHASAPALAGTGLSGSDLLTETLVLYPQYQKAPVMAPMGRGSSVREVLAEGRRVLPCNLLVRAGWCDGVFDIFIERESANPRAHGRISVHVRSPGAIADTVVHLAAEGAGFSWQPARPFTFLTSSKPSAPFSILRDQPEITFLVRLKRIGRQ